MNLLFMFLQLIEGTRKLHWDFHRTDSIRSQEILLIITFKLFMGVILQSLLQSCTKYMEWSKGLWEPPQNWPLYRATDLLLCEITIEYVALKVGITLHCTQIYILLLLFSNIPEIFKNRLVVMSKRGQRIWCFQLHNWFWDNTSFLYSFSTLWALSR